MATTTNYFGIDSQWYLAGHGSYENLHLVNEECRNEALGIRHIKFLQPDTKSDRAPLANVKLNMAFGITVDAAIYVADDGQSLRLNVTQRPGELGADKKPVRYYDIVTIPRAVQAQVLRHATAVLSEHIVAPKARAAAPAGDAEYQAYLAYKNAQEAASTAASVPAAAAVPAATSIPNEFNVEAKTGFETAVTPEQLAAMQNAGIFNKF